MAFTFGEFELDVRLCVLRRRGKAVPVQPKVFDTLRYLIEHRDHVVSKEELLDAIWEGRVVNRVAVPWSIRHARKALGQTGAESHPIETVRGRGYRFSAEVSDSRDSRQRGNGAGAGAPPPAPDAFARSGADGEPFLGREPVMQRLVRALNDARSGRGGLALLTGEAGIGKTRCANELAAYARRSGLGVWVGRCVGTGGAPAFWPWIQILRESLEDRRVADAERKVIAAMVDRLVPRGQVAGEAPRGGAQAPSDASRFWLSEALARCLKQAAAKRPRVVVMEDLHAADEASLEALALLAPELATSSLLVVATSRDGIAGQASERLARRLRPCDVIPLAGLTFDEVERYIAETLGREAPGELVRAVYAKTAGVPLWLEEAVRLLAARQARQGSLRAEDVALPEVARGLLRERIETLDAATREVLDAASVLGEEFELPVLRRMLDVPGDRLLAKLDVAVRARFIEPRPRGDAYAFGHALVREAVYGHLPSADRLRLHARAAAALRSLDALESRSSAIAHHLHNALPEANATDVVHYGRLAGDAAMQVFAYDEAARFYGWALSAQAYADAPDARSTCELFLSAAHALRHAGHVREARARCRRAVDIAQRENFAELLVDAACSLRPTVWIAQVPDELVLGALEHARKILPEGATAARARALGMLANIPPYSMDVESSRDLSARAAELARAVGDRRLVNEALVASFHALMGPDSIDALLAVADEVLRADGPPITWLSAEAYFGRYHALLHRGDAMGAERALESFGACARLVRRPEALWQYERIRAQHALYSGDFETAESRFHDLFARSEGFRMYGTFIYAAQMNALSWQRAGRPLPLADLALGRTADVSWQWAASIPSFRAERILVLLDAGDVAAAAAELDAVAKDDFAGVTRDLGYLYALSKLALAAVALDRRDRARALYERLRPYAGYNAINGLSICLGSVSHYLGVLARYLGLRAEAAAHFDASVAMNTRLSHDVHARRSKLAFDELTAG